MDLRQKEGDRYKCVTNMESETFPDKKLFLLIRELKPPAIKRIYNHTVG